MDKISIVVPVFNCEKYIERCLNSIKNQSYENLEILMVNDGSTDESGRICKEFAAGDNRFVYIEQQNSGVSAARNKGVSVSTGAYVGFVDCDDVIHPKMFEQLLNLCKENDCDIASCGMMKFYSQQAVERLILKDESELRNVECLKDVDLKEVLNDFWSMKKINWSLCTKLIKRELMVSTPLEGYNGEDTRCLLRLFLKTKRIVSAENSFYFYFKNNSESFTKKFSVRSIDIINYYDLFGKTAFDAGDSVLGEKCMAKKYILEMNCLTRVYFGDRNAVSSLKKLIKEEYKEACSNRFLGKMQRINAYLYLHFPLVAFLISRPVLYFKDWKRNYQNKRAYINELNLLAIDK